MIGAEKKFMQENTPSISIYYISTYTSLHYVLYLFYRQQTHQLFNSSTTNNFYSIDLQILLTELHCFSHLKWMRLLQVIMVSFTTTTPSLNHKQIMKLPQILYNKSVLLSEIQYYWVPLKLAASENFKLRGRRTFLYERFTLVHWFLCALKVKIDFSYIQKANMIFIQSIIVTVLLFVLS